MTTETLYFRTEPSRRTRQPGKPLAPTPHARILEIRRTPFPSDVKGVIGLGVTAAMGAGVEAYFRKNFDENGDAVRDVNCAHLVEWMKGAKKPDCLESAKALDEIQGRTLAPPYALQLGHIGVIATSENLADPDGLEHFLHTGIGVAENTWICVTGLRGDIAIASISDDIAYQRRHIIPDESGIYTHISPSSVQLYDHGPLPALSPETA